MEALKEDGQSHMVEKRIWIHQKSRQLQQEQERVKQMQVALQADRECMSQLVQQSGSLDNIWGAIEDEMVERGAQQLSLEQSSEVTKEKLKAARAALKGYEDSVMIRQQDALKIMTEDSVSTADSIEKREADIRSKQDELNRLEKALTAREKELVAGESSLRERVLSLSNDQQALEEKKDSLKKRRVRRLHMKEVIISSDSEGEEMVHKDGTPVKFLRYTPQHRNALSPYHTSRSSLNVEEFQQQMKSAGMKAKPISAKAKQR